MLFFVEKEIGLFLKFAVVVQPFIPDKLLFEFADVKTVGDEGLSILTSLYYENRLIFQNVWH